jgi:hypothetical protein
MDKRAAKRWACRCAWKLLNNDHNNGFLYGDDPDDVTPDDRRKQAAWEELCAELARRGEERYEKP